MLNFYQKDSVDSGEKWMQTRVQNDGDYSLPFPVTYCIKRVLLHKLCSACMMFSAMPTDDFQDCGSGCPIRHRYDFGEKLCSIC